MENGYYDEKESRPLARFGVRDVGRFISAILRVFVNKGTLYISSYDFGYWADRLTCFKSDERVKLATSSMSFRSIAWPISMRGAPSTSS